MLKIFKYNSEEKEIRQNNFSVNAIYVYHNEVKNILIYSDNLKELIDCDLLPSKFEIDNQSISHLFMTSIVPPPMTVYKNLYKIGHGVKAKFFSDTKKVKIKFNEDTDIYRNNLNNSYNENDEEFILKKLFEEIKAKKNNSYNDFLFQSSGKDSNMIALSYSMYGRSKDLTCLTYNDEEIFYAKKISEKLGIKHISLKIPQISNLQFENRISSYMENSFFPNTDNAFMGYFFYNDGLLNYPNNLIDGMGNDAYIGHVPKKKEYRMQFFSNYFSKLNFLTKYTNSILINELFKKKYYWTGLVGLPILDNKNILKGFSDVSEFYENKYDKSDNYFLIRSKIRGRYVDLEKFITKLQCHCQIINSNSIFPWTNLDLVNFFLNLDGKYLFDKKFLKNKLILRKILKKNLNIDFDKIGKKDFKFDYWKLMSNNEHFVKKEINNCLLFYNKDYLKLLIDKLFNNSYKNNILSNRSKTLLNQIFQICLWYNNSNFIKR